MAMINKLSNWISRLALLFLCVAPVPVGASQILRGSIPPAVASRNLRPAGNLAATNLVHLGIGLALHNREALTNLIQQLYDPASTNFHRYLTLEKFTRDFGPTEAEYEAVLQFATNSGFTVTRTFRHRRMLGVTATVADIQKAFHVHLLRYQHPTESRQFYAPDVDPSFDPSVPIQCVNGLNDYSRPFPGAHPRDDKQGRPGGSGGGTRTGGWWGNNFRNAYAPGVQLNGAGQYVGLVEFDGYYPQDIVAYEASNNIPPVALINVVEPDGSAQPDNNTNAVFECSLDIEQAIAMAPGLSGVYIFEGNPGYNILGTGDFDSILDSMTEATWITQFSSSWSGYGFNGYVFDNGNGDDSLAQMAAQGQTFFQASGDGDAYTQSIAHPCDSPYAISVGGTSLTMDSAGSNYLSETVWNGGFQVPAWGGNGAGTLNGTNGGWWGSGGGVSGNYAIPSWQQTLNPQQLTALGGSTSQRNIPDVALTATGIRVIYFNGIDGGAEGTSCAAPLWAGFIALVNQQAALEGKPSVGFLSPAFYIIGQSAFYASTFNDITNGNDEWPGSPSFYQSAAGYDLCTGWGTPNGQAMINALLDYSGQTWVNFSAPCVGSGTYAVPYCNLVSGLLEVPANGTVCLVGPNSTTETPTITNAMTLRAFYGPVTIGN
jgi:subtilase family serine protease